MKLSCCTVPCSWPLAPTCARRASGYFRTRNSVITASRSGTYLFEVQGEAEDDRPTSPRSEEAVLRRYKDLLRDSGVVDALRARKHLERPRDKRRRERRELVAQRKWERDNPEWRPETLSSAGGEGQSAEPFADVFSLHDPWASPASASSEPPLLFDSLEHPSNSQAGAYAAGGYLPPRGRGGQQAAQWLNDPSWQGGYLEDLPLAANPPAAAGAAAPDVRTSPATASTWSSSGSYVWGVQSSYAGPLLSASSNAESWAVGTGAVTAPTNNQQQQWDGLTAAGASTQHTAAGGYAAQPSAAGPQGIWGGISGHPPQQEEQRTSQPAAAAAAAAMDEVASAAATPLGLAADAPQGTSPAPPHQQEQHPSVADLRRAFSPDMMLWEERAAEASAQLAAAAACIAGDVTEAVGVPNAAAAAAGWVGQEAGEQLLDAEGFEDVADVPVTAGDAEGSTAWELQQLAESVRREAVMQQQLLEYDVQQRAMQQQEQEEVLAAFAATGAGADVAWADISEQQQVVLAGLTSPTAQAGPWAAISSTSSQLEVGCGLPGVEQSTSQQQGEVDTWQATCWPTGPAVDPATLPFAASDTTDTWQAKEAALLEKEELYTARIQDLQSYEQQLEDYHQQLLAYQHAQEQYWSDVAAATVGAAAAGAAAGQYVVSAAAAAGGTWAAPAAATDTPMAAGGAVEDISIAAPAATGAEYPATAVGGVATSQPLHVGGNGDKASVSQRSGPSRRSKAASNSSRRTHQAASAAQQGVSAPQATQPGNQNGSRDANLSSSSTKGKRGRKPSGPTTAAKAHMQGNQVAAVADNRPSTAAGRLSSSPSPLHSTTAAGAGHTTGEEQPLRLPSVAVAAAVRDAQAVASAVEQVLAVAAQMGAAASTPRSSSRPSGTGAKDAAADGTMDAAGGSKSKARAGRKQAKVQHGSTAK